MGTPRRLRADADLFQLATKVLEAVDGLRQNRPVAQLPLREVIEHLMADLFLVFVHRPRKQTIQVFAETVWVERSKPSGDTTPWCQYRAL